MNAPAIVLAASAAYDFRGITVVYFSKLEYRPSFPLFLINNCGTSSHPNSPISKPFALVIAEHHCSDIYKMSRACTQITHRIGGI